MSTKICHRVKVVMSRKVEQTKDRILSATVELLLTGKPADVRMADIAKRAGITRQALYLHFANRASLLIAATQYVDGKKDIDARLAPSRAADQGTERLALYIDAWGNYIPEIFGIARGLISVYDSDAAAAAAWDDRWQQWPWLRGGGQSLAQRRSVEAEPQGRHRSVVWSVVSGALGVLGTTLRLVPVKVHPACAATGQRRIGHSAVIFANRARLQDKRWRATVSTRAVSVRRRYRLHLKACAG
ncbi:MAG: TetR/AcrR family transcriptional regulator [Pseudohongiellaceae bacterium]